MKKRKKKGRRANGVASRRRRCLKKNGKHCKKIMLRKGLADRKRGPLRGRGIG